MIDPFLAELAQFDVAATAADPDGAGPLTTGYDPEFRETCIVPDASWRGYDARREKPPILVPCQVEVSAFEVLQELATGNSPRSNLVLVFHFLDLERMNLVDAAMGEALLRVDDRLISIRDYNTAELIQEVRTPPGLYITEAQPVFGLGMKRNLLLATFADRALGPRGGA